MPIRDPCSASLKSSGASSPLAAAGSQMARSKALSTFSILHDTTVITINMPFSLLCSGEEDLGNRLAQIYCTKSSVALRSKERIDSLVSQALNIKHREYPRG